MKILITGVAGFIGFHTALRYLNEGHDVVGIDNLNNYYDVRLKNERLNLLKNKNFEFHKLDISDYPSLRKTFENYSFDSIIHLAAQAGVRYSLIDPHSYELSNNLGTLNMFELTRLLKVPKIVYASSSSVYGNSKVQPCVETQDTNKPISLYAATKKSNENLAYSYYSMHGIKSVGLRFFTVYGPWGRPDMALFIFAKKIKSGEKLPVFNHGLMERDFTYVDDIVDGIIRSVNSDLGCEIFNLGSNKPIALLDFIKLIENNLGEKAELDLLPMQLGDVKRSHANIDKAKSLIGYKPNYNTVVGVNNFCDWFKENLSLVMNLKENN